MGALLTQTIPENLKSDKGFIKKLADFIGKSVKETDFLVQTARPQEPAFKTMRKSGNNEFAVNLENKLKKLVDLKYGNKNKPQ
jgi:hypothetical protein